MADTTTAAQFLADPAKYDAQGPVDIVDTASDIANAFDGLQDYSADIASITISDKAQMFLTAAEVANDGAVLGLLSSGIPGYPVTLGISDTGANLSAAMSAIEALETRPNTVVQVKVSDDDDLTLTASEFVADARALAVTTNASGKRLQIDIVASAADISMNFDELATAFAAREIAGIDVSDGGKVTLTADEVANDQGAIALLKNPDGSPARVVTGGITAANFLDNLSAYSATNKAVISDTAADLTAAMRGSLEKSFADIASIFVSDDDALTLTASEFVADADVLALTGNADGDPLQIDIVDTAADIEAHFGALAAAGSEIVSITMSDGGALTLTADEVANDAAAIWLLQPAGGKPVSLAVSDTAATIASDLDALHAFLIGGGVLTAITVNDSAALTLTAEEAADDQLALALLRNPNGKPSVVSVSDSDEHIQTYLPKLADNAAALSSINVADGKLTLSADDVIADQSALSLLTTDSTFAVSDTSADEVLALDDLQQDLSHIVSITATDLSSGNDTLIVSVEAFVNDPGAIARIVDVNGSAVKVAVSDTAADISADIDTLDDALAKGNLTGITLTGSDDDIVVTVAQFINDKLAISAILNGNPSARFEIKDSEQNLANAFGTLAADSDDAFIAEIATIDGGAVPLPVATADSTSVSALLAMLQADFAPLSYVVYDTAATISANIDNLAAEATLPPAIVISDNRPIALDVNQIATGSAAIALLQNADELLSVRIDVADTAADISGGFDSTLATLSLNGKSPIAKISVTDGGKVSLSADDFLNDGALIAEIQGAKEIDVVDTAANIQAALPTLLKDIKEIGGIEISDADDILIPKAQQTTTYKSLIAKLSREDGKPPVATLPVLTWAAYTADSEKGIVPKAFAIGDSAANIEAQIDFISGIAGLSYIEVTGGSLQFTASEVDDDLSILGLLETPSGAAATFAVSDTAANLVANIDALEAAAGQISAITATDKKVLTGLTAAQIANDYSVLSRIQAGVTVSDVAATIADDFLALETDSKQVTSIAINDGGTLALTADDVESGQATLNALYAGDDTIKFDVTGDGSTIQSDLDALEKNISHISSIAIADGDYALTATAEQFANDGDAIGMIESDNSNATFSLTDAAANISKYLDKLNSATTITISDNAPVAVTIAQLTSDANAIAALVNANGSAAAIETSDTAANIIADASNLPASSKVVVEDTAANIIANASALAGISRITAIDASGTGAQMAADASQILAILPSASHSFSVTDTAKIIAANLDKLAGIAGLISVVASDNKPIVVSIAQLMSDGSVIAAIEAADPTGKPLEIADSFAHATSAAGLAALEAAAPYIASMNLSGSATAFTVAEYKQDKDALDAIGASKPISIVDTAAEILGAMMALRADTAVKSVAVVDTAADISAELDNLDDALSLSGASIASIAISDNAPLTLDVAQLGDTLALAKLPGSYKVDIVDTAANLASGKTALTGNAHVAAEFIEDTAADAGAAASAFGDDAGKGGYKKLAGVEIADTASNIENNLSGLASGLASLTSKKGKLEILATDTVVDVSFSQFGSYKSLLDDVIGGFDITDTAANLGTSALNALKADSSHIDRLTVTGGLAGVSVATALTDASVLKDVSSFSISDSFSQISTNLAKLASAADLASLTSITVSSGTTGVLALTAAEAAALGSRLSGDFDIVDTAANIAKYADALEAEDDKIATLTVKPSGVVTVSAAAAVADYSLLELTGQFAIRDTGANISASLGALLNDASHIASISLSSGAVDVSEYSLAIEAPLLSKIAGGVIVQDSASDIHDNLSYLNALTVRTSEPIVISAIALLSGTLDVSVQDLQTYKDLLAKVTGGVTVQDSASAIDDHLAFLKQEGAHVSAIQLIGEIAGQSATFETKAGNDTTAHDKSVIAKIEGPYVLELTDASGAIQSEQGYGDDLTLVDNGGASKQTLTGGGNGETFDLGANFGTAVITDFAAHAAGTSHDTIVFTSNLSSIGNIQDLLGSATISYAGGNVTIKVGADSLTIDGIGSSTQLAAAYQNGDFVLHSAAAV